MKLALLLAVALLFALAACADLIGIEHYEAALGGAPGWECAVPEQPPSAGTCVPFTAPPDAGELEAGLDDAGHALVTVCNPVTNAGCTGTDVCGPDDNFANFVCLSTGAAPAPLCTECTFFTCGPGLFCAPNGSTCVQMCCTDDDCGAGHCSTTQLATPLPYDVGLCTQ